MARYCTAYFNRFTIQLSRFHALNASWPGRDAEGPVMQLIAMPYVRKQLDKIVDLRLRKELEEYGAWDAEELANRADNEKRVVWLAAGRIREETPARLK